MATLKSDYNSIYHFAFLGQKQEESLEILIDKTSSVLPTDYWATLGWDDDAPFKFEGEIQFSEIGNTKSEGSTGKIVSELKLIHPEIAQTPLIERYINFDSAALSKKNKKIRLDVFLKKDEGAVVYIEHSLKGNYNEEDAEIQFILPQKTNEDFDTNRNRLTYYVENINDLYKKFQNKINLLEGEQLPTSFIVKVLTFKRGEGKAKELYKNAIKNISFSVGSEFLERIGDEKYKLLVFNPNGVSTDSTLGGSFELVSSFNELKKDVKTLFLIHGTFSSTLNTFRHLHKKGANQTSFLQDLLNNHQYEQIIAFDHPTISHNVADNIAHLLDNYLIDNSFNTTEIDILACSRGCILAEGLSNFDSTTNLLKINKIMLFSAANGVNYFKLGENICHFLSVWKKTASGPFLKVVLTLTEFSADFFLELRGCQQMTPGSDSLKLILNKEPHQTNAKFYLFVSDWKFQNARGRFFKRSGALILDFTISKILGKKHDWVVGCESQKKLPKNSNLAKIIHLNTMHCKYFDASYTIPSSVLGDLVEVMKG
jgi:hypothetical protein